MSGWDLVIKFPDQSPSFAHGFEAGRIWQQLKAGAAVIEQTINEENVELVAQMAERCGYSSTFVQLAEGWVTAKIEWPYPVPKGETR